MAGDETSTSASLVVLALGEDWPSSVESAPPHAQLERLFVDAADCPELQMDSRLHCSSWGASRQTTRRLGGPFATIRASRRAQSTGDGGMKWMLSALHRCSACCGNVGGAPSGASRTSAGGSANSWRGRWPREGVAEIARRAPRSEADTSPGCSAVHKLTHWIPAGSNVVAPADATVVAVAPLLADWDAVTEPMLPDPEGCQHRRMSRHDRGGDWARKRRRNPIWISLRIKPA
jgi:hypothetical protein